MTKSSMPAFVNEPARETPVRGTFDVVVAGGGIAGVAAAVAAARGGATVCLLEKAAALGGLATLGNVINWLPLCDGRGRQVSAGLAEELLKLAAADRQRPNDGARFSVIPPCWRLGGDSEERRRVRYRVDFNPGAYLLALERFATDAGVRLLYDTRVCAVRREGDLIAHLIVENKGGRSALACGAAVDATGDADVCFLAGEPTHSLDTNVPCGWFYHLHDGRPRLNVLSQRRGPGDSGPLFRGDDGDQVTDQILGSRDLIRRRVEELRAAHPDAEIEVILPPTMACFRMTRRLMGATVLHESDAHRWFDDAVGLVSDWRRPGPVFALPLSALRGVACRNLLAAGRCLSAAPCALDVLRSIPGCAVSGEAAGTAAAMAVRAAGGDLGALPVPALQQTLRDRGVLLDPVLARPAPPPPDVSKCPAPTA